MNKLFSVFISLLLISACSPAEEKAAEPQSTAQQEALPAPDEQIYSFDINTLKPGCSSDSELICAINLSIKCTVNPQFAECAAHKGEMPKFIFMEDESLQRPTSQSYKITKLKPLPDNMVEVYTQSTCNGNWFGLCNGNIIYVMKIKEGKWIVKDLYAVES